MASHFLSRAGRCCIVRLLAELVQRPAQRLWCSAVLNRYVDINIDCSKGKLVNTLSGGPGKHGSGFVDECLARFARPEALHFFAACQQVIQRALILDAAFFKHHDPVGPPQRRAAVRNGQHGGGLAGCAQPSP